VTGAELLEAKALLGSQAGPLPIKPCQPTFPEHGNPVRARPPLNPTIEEIIAMVRDVAPLPPSSGKSPLNGARAVLEWLELSLGECWQERWESSGADDGLAWIEELVAADPRSPTTSRPELMSGVYRLLLCRVIYPSYGFFTQYSSYRLYIEIRKRVTPELFAMLSAAGDELRMHAGQKADGIRVVTKMVLCTGKGVAELTAADVHGYREWHRDQHGGRPVQGMIAAWDMLRKIGVTEDTSLLADTRQGQHSSTKIVDYYEIKNPQIKELLIRYLDERRAALDYSSLRSLALRIVCVFWADIERNHPEQKDLDLSREVYEAWRERARWRRPHKPDEPLIERKDMLAVLTAVRGFYLDIQEWARQDAYWAGWAAPCPVRRREVAGHGKHVRNVQAEIHQRIRERLMHLSTLVAVAEDQLADRTQLLTSARATAIDKTFVHAGVTYRRVLTKAAKHNPGCFKVHDALIVNEQTGERVDVEAAEQEAFWAWAMTETLRHTGVRMEELCELTMLSLISYRIPKTGEVVPMLQVTPSKSNQERLLLVSPELASTLARIVSRLREKNDGEIPLVERYDQLEKTIGPSLPHLFQHQVGWRNQVFSNKTVTKLLNVTVARAGLVDATGKPLRITAHDYRRMFATEAVTEGLPVHIAARILGHDSLVTTQHYLAVFQDDMVTAYREFLSRRRSLRPSEEYREPTAQEWQEFQDHFELRKVSLGDCGRPYAVPCQYEHACIRCPILHVDPRQRSRLVEIVQNLRDRIAEANNNGWLGEVEGLKVSLEAAALKLTAMDRAARQRGKATTSVALGLPAIR